MAQIGADELIDEVQALVGRTGDTVLITDARVTRWLNEGQEEIVKACPGLIAMEFNDSTSLETVENQLQYALSDVTVGDLTTSGGVAHVQSLFYVNAEESFKLDFKPQDEFDEAYPDPTYETPARPHSWTRRGDNVEIVPVPSEDYEDVWLRLHGTRYALDFTLASSCESELDRADKGLILYSVAQAWDAIGDEASNRKSTKWSLKFGGWLNNYKNGNDAMLAWDGETLFDGIL